MTSLGTTAVSGAAAKIVPGAALTPCELDARVDYQQERLALLAGFALTVSSLVQPPVARGGATAA